MKKTLAWFAAAAVLCSAPAFAAEFKGRISDSLCNAKHADGEHGTKKMTDRACVEACVKDHNGKYVFVGDGDKVYKIANQDLPALKAHAAHENVTVTGDLKGDTLTITKIEMPAAKK